jgi:integrase
LKKRQRNDGLPHRLYERKGKFKYSITYKAIVGKGFTYSCEVGDGLEIERIKRKAIDRVYKEIGDVPKSKTLAKYFADYFDWQESLPDDHVDRKKESTLQGNKEEQKNILAVFGDMDPNEIKPAHVRKYLKLRSDAGAPAKANKEKSLLSAVYKYLIREMVVEANPCFGVEKNKTKAKDKLVTPEQRRLLESVGKEQGGAYERMTLAFRLAFLTSSRADEIRTLLWEEFGDALLIIKIGKSRNTSVEKYKSFEVGGEILGIRNRLAELNKTESVYVFCNKMGNQYTRSGWGANLKKLKEACRLKAKELGVPWQDFALTDMRVSSVTHRVESGEHYGDIIKTTGHASTAMLKKHYDRTKVQKVKVVAEDNMNLKEKKHESN